MGREANRDDAPIARIVPERIREAREARGLTAEEFAEKIGISRQAVGQFEIGQTTPSAQTMSAIIGVTAQPPGFFTDARKRAVEDFGTPFWRSLKRMTRPDRLRVTRRLEWAWDVVHYLEQFIDLPTINLPAVDWDFETGNDEQLERITGIVRDDWSLGRGPIFNLAAVLEANGVILLREKVECEDMDAVSRWQGGRPFILCSADKNSLPRENFDLAHELGHLLLHHGIEVTPETLNKLERQANYFAAAFLLPRATFAREVISTSVHYFLKLKERWRVSVAAMIYRSRDLAILSKSQVEYLWRQLSARGMRKEEPLDRTFAVEKPTLLFAALKMLVQNGVRTRADILDSLNLNPEDVESICAAETGFLAQTVVPLQLRPRTTS
ncbi:MAG: ImmA/IrrE family metallo-endopeptidase [Bradyrhizobiaceae bacterium]|nr:ImmA/IrrE family metallo-endopeptidase [Hyphomicrobiales bacterium]MBV9427312.1 ImmA/IrrE family metallo-endopeptidase [Bradyrhizobiaceae bacterium]